MEDLAHTCSLELAFICIGDDAAHDDRYICELRLLQRLQEFRHQKMVRGERGYADNVHVLLLSQPHHLVDFLPGRRVEDLHTGVAQKRRYHAAAAVVAVKADLCDEHLGRWLAGLPRRALDHAATPWRSAPTN